MTHKNEEKCIVNPLLFQYVYIKDIYDNIPVHFYKKQSIANVFVPSSTDVIIYKEETQKKSVKF